MAAGKGLGLHILALCEAGASADIAASHHDWEEAEATHPGLKVTIVEVAGRVAQQTVARALFQCVMDTPPRSISLDFNTPLIGNVRSILLEGYCDTRHLTLEMSHCTLCACHGAPVALKGADGRAINIGAPLTGQNKFRCPITGTTLDPRHCIQDGKTICLGNNSAAGLLHLKESLSIANAATSAVDGNGMATAPVVLRVLSKIKMGSFNAALLYGPPITLRAPNKNNLAITNTNGNQSCTSAGAAAGVSTRENINSSFPPAVKVAVDGELVSVYSEQLLGLVAKNLKDNGEGLMCFSTTDIHSGHSGLFRHHYLLVPFTEGGSSNKQGLCALKVASMEELAPPPAPAAPNVLPDVPAAVAAAVQTQLEKLRLEEYNPTSYSSKVHETIEMLMRDSKPAKPVSAAAATPLEGPAGGGGCNNQAPVSAPAATGTAVAPSISKPSARGGHRGTRGRGGQGRAGRATRR